MIFHEVTDKLFKLLLNGKIAVGNALKLGGKEASEYALAEELAKVDGTKVLTAPILETALSLPNGEYEYKMGGYDYTDTSDLPHRNYAWGYATIYKWNDEYVVVHLHGYWTWKPVWNAHTNDGWTGWNETATTADLANYLPLTGGRVYGGTTSDPLVITGKNAESFLRYEGDIVGTVGWIGFEAINKPVVLLNDGLTKYDILHTGNKPSGSYTGNGSAESRTIETGGIGSVCAIWGNSSMCLVTSQGAFWGSSVGFAQNMDTKIKFQNGKLIIESTTGYANANGVVYSYQVL